MRTTFHQFFRPTKDEMDAMLAHALICYDANVLLNIYRYSEETQMGLVEVFKTFADRTRLPHQVALEYARNRGKTIVDQVNHCEATERAFAKVVDDFIKPKNKQPFLSAGSATALEGIMEELAKKRKALESMISEDSYADLLHSLFDQRISALPDEKTLEQLHKEAADRYERKIPPGYSDLAEKEIPRAYGDYIAWRQLMDLAAQEKKDFILVTDDSKGDWYLKLKGKTIGPRPELLEEFHRETGQRIWLFDSEAFLIATKKAGSAQIADSVIEEVGAHLVAQSSAPASEDKLSSPRIESEHATGLASEFKLSSPRIERAKLDAFASEPQVQDAKLSTPGKETAALTDKKTAVVGGDDGGDE